MVNPGIWVLWRHQLPPLDTIVESKYDDGDQRAMRGKRCKRGCCFFPEGWNDGLVTPTWWRLPESENRSL